MAGTQSGLLTALIAILLLHISEGQSYLAPSTGKPGWNGQVGSREGQNCTRRNGDGMGGAGVGAWAGWDSNHGIDTSSILFPIPGHMSSSHVHWDLFQLNHYAGSN